MERIPSIFVAIFVVFCSVSASADCTNANDVDDVIGCLLERHPKLSISKAELEVAQGEVSRSSQMINPSLEWEFTESQGSNGFTNEVNLTHTLELGGKRLGLSLIWIVSYIVAPLVEEPWLERKYGVEYSEYKRRVRRFF